MREKIDIEHLLTWAYRDQCIDRQVKRLAAFRGPPSLQSLLGTYMELGVRVDCASAAICALGERVIDDALIIHDTVLALGNIWIEMQDDVVELWDEERAKDEGQIIEQRHGRWFRQSSVRAKDEAEQLTPLGNAHVHSMLIIHAKAGSRPESYTDWMCPAQVVSAGLNPPKRRGRKPVAMDFTFEEVMFQRALYLAWHAALTRLGQQLEGVLKRFDVAPPSAPQCPWENAIYSNTNTLGKIAL